MIDMFFESAVPKMESDIRKVNTENRFAADVKYDLVITSPPYGDSRTTVAYGQYTSFGIDWTKDINPYCDGKTGYTLDSQGLGVYGELNDKLILHGGVLGDILQRISLIDEKRVQDVLYFFNGYYSAVRNIVCALRVGGVLCFVVGNRIVKGIQIPMDQITASFLESLGMKFCNIFVREISNKLMPLKNSPSNVAGDTSRTMTKEYIIIFKKEKK